MMTLSDQVRDFFQRHYVGPARMRRQSRTAVAVSDVSRHFGWSNRFPLICSALTAKSFHDELGVELITVTDPCPSSTTVLTFAVTP
jgi:5-methylcytosine-specific restriction protein B